MFLEDLLISSEREMVRERAAARDSGDAGAVSRYNRSLVQVRDLLPHVRSLISEMGW